MKEILIADKQKFLNENYPFGDPPALTDKVKCLHCGELITVGDYKVFKETGDNFFTSIAPMLLNAMER